jgi:hypothetical protein
MDIKQFIAENDVDKGNALIDVTLLEQAEQLVCVRFGEELTEYLLKYGYLGFLYVELYGMNSRQGLESDMIKQTLYLHKYFPLTKAYVAIENQGEGDYFLVDSDDVVYEYISEQNNLLNIGMKLNQYILHRFQEAKNP